MVCTILPPRHGHHHRLDRDRWYLRYHPPLDNKRLARLENESVPLSESDLRKLQKTADMEGIDIATARQLQKGYRFMI
jgi:hypothetical protein